MRTRRAQAVRWCVVVSAVIVACAGVDVGHRSGIADSATPRPFDMPTVVTAHTTAKKVFAHFLTPFPISIDNEPAERDYYAQGYLDPAGESGEHRASGGFIRQRPLPRPVDPSPNWQFDDLKTDVLRAAAAGIDGFTVDLLDLTGYNWDRVDLLMSAAHAADPNFAIMVMPDATTSVVDDPHALAVAVAHLASQPAAYHLADGRLVVSPFFAEGRSATWWQGWLTTMRNEFGIEVAFVPTFLDSGYAPSFRSISYGFSTWGERSPSSIGSSIGDAQYAHANGKIWMQPVAVQDVRPVAGMYTEANNTETLRGLWNIAIGQGAEWVQLVTWNDYSEGTEIAPSSHTGWSPLDLVAYYATAFKTGAAPPIVRDVIYLSHRIQSAAALPTGPQTELMELRASSSSPARDRVEVLSFLTAPATVVVRMGAATYNYSAAAGVSVTTVPLGIGQVSASITYANGARLSVVSPNLVVARPVIQDLQYYFVSSGRDGSVSGTPPSPPVTSPPTTAPMPTVPPATTAPPTPITAPAATVPPQDVEGLGVAVASPPVPIWAR